MIKPNYLSPVEYRFAVKRLPHVSFFVQAINLPGLNTGATIVPTPFRNYPLHGDKLEFDDLTLDVAMDENMKSFIEVRNWIYGLSKPENFYQYANLLKGEGLYSDATLIILNSSKNSNIEITFKDIFPTNLGSIQFDTRATTVDVPVCNMTFKFMSYDINLSS
jgi:hypothetical protein